MATAIGVGLVQVGERRRERYGDLGALAESIERHGLIQPIVIDSDRRLVCGGRRLEACRRLGFATIEARDAGDLTPVELRELELEENVRRKDLTAYERSKFMAEYGEAAEEAAREEAVIEAKNGESKSRKSNQGNDTEFSGHRGQKNGGRPQGTTKRGSGPDVETRTNIPRKTMDRAKEHVSAADRYPFLRQPHWTQSGAIEAMKLLDAMPEMDRSRASAMADEPGIPPDEALTMFRTLGAMKAKNREAVLRDFESGDDQRKSNAQTCAAAKPPMPDKRLALGTIILRDIGKAQRLGDDREYNIAIKAITRLQERLENEYEREAKALARRRD